MNDIEKTINNAWKIKDQINPNSDKSIIDAIKETITFLNAGKITVAEPQGGDWKINQWIQKGILLSFRVNKRKVIGGPYNAWNDFEHLPGKTAGWTEKDFEKAGFRMVPNCVVRNGSFIGRGAVIMPNSFINIGGYCGEKSMVDTGARIGSCARLGANCHLSAGVGLGGILEPVGSKPTIIEDDCLDWLEVAFPNTYVPPRLPQGVPGFRRGSQGTPGTPGEPKRLLGYPEVPSGPPLNCEGTRCAGVSPIHA